MIWTGFLWVSIATPGYWITPLSISDAFKLQLNYFVQKRKVNLKLWFLSIGLWEFEIWSLTVKEGLKWKVFAMLLTRNLENKPVYHVHPQQSADESCGKCSLRAVPAVMARTKGAVMCLTYEMCSHDRQELHWATWRGDRLGRNDTAWGPVWCSERGSSPHHVQQGL
jgi:hypothetical protein